MSIARYLLQEWLISNSYLLLLLPSTESFHLALVCWQLLQYLHSENKLSKRFPIGLEEQIKKWDADKIRKFHERWYFPANATLYIVGDIDDIPRTVKHIEVYSYRYPVIGSPGLYCDI